MKILVTLKDPDGFSTCVEEAVEKAVEKEFPTADDNEIEVIKESRVDKAWKILGQWVSYKEYVTLEFDTEMGTVTVLKRKS